MGQLEMAWISPTALQRSGTSGAHIYAHRSQPVTRKGLGFDDLAKPLAWLQPARGESVVGVAAAVLWWRSCWITSSCGPSPNAGSWWVPQVVPQELLATASRTIDVLLSGWAEFAFVVPPRVGLGKRAGSPPFSPFRRHAFMSCQVSYPSATGSGRDGAPDCLSR
jgi:hypothetical protein